MAREVLARTLALLALSAAILAQSSPPQFKVSVEYVEVEARVLDDQGQPVRGLTRDTFRVLEDGVAQNVAAFSEIDLPLPPAPPETAQRPAEIIRPDVSSNQRKAPSGRVYLIFLNDFFIDPSRTEPTRQLIRRFIERSVGPDDLVAISSGGRSTAFQNFTSDKRLLLDAVSRLSGWKDASPTTVALTSVEAKSAMNGGLQPTPSPPVAPSDKTMTQARTGQAGLLSAVAWMAAMEARSKAVLVVGEGVPLKEITEVESLAFFLEFDPALGAARRSSIPIHTIDPRGATSLAEESIQVGASSGGTPTAAYRGELRTSQDLLRRLADDTGGAAVVGTNDFDGGFDRIVRHASAFYVLGYSSSNPKRDGKRRKIQISVDRPGVHVVARSGYTAVLDRPANRTAAPAPTGSPNRLAEALNSRLPAGGLTMSATAAAFRGRTSTASVAVVLEANGSDLALTERNGKFVGQLNVMVGALDQLGKLQASETKSFDFDLPRDIFERVQSNGFRWLSRLDVKPGRYQIRVAAASGLSPGGSVWYDLEVSNLRDGELAMSGILVAAASASRAPTVRPDPMLDGVLPGPPTAHRDFVTGDDLAVFAEVYDNKLSARRDVDVTVTIRTEGGREVFRQSDTVTSDQLRSRQGTYRSITRIPLQVLPGSYVLTIEAERPDSKDEPIRRAIPFRVVAN